MRRGLVRAGAVAAALVAVAALYTLRPVVLGERIPVAQVVALKGLLAAALVALGLVVALVGGVLLIARRTGKVDGADGGPGAMRPARGSRAVVVLLACGLVTALTGGAHGLALVDRGRSGDGVLAGDDPPSPEAFTVLTLNTLGGASSPVDVVDLAERTGADVLALPETPAPLAVEISGLLEERTGQGYSAWTEGTGPVASTSLVAADALGPYEQVSGYGQGDFGRVHLRPTGDDDRQPVLVAAHPVPPVSGNMSDWRAENLGLVGLCERAVRPTIIAGDLNMTLDHDTLSGVASGSGPCQDAGVDAGIGGIGTWPTSSPTWAGSVIDHVLVSGGLRGASGEVTEAGDSDHRAVVVELRLTGGS